VQSVERLVGQPLGLDKKDLQAVRLQPVHSQARAEAL
jgi:hypothetical protein